MNENKQAATNGRKPANTAADKSSKKKDSTNILPMFSIEEAVSLAGKIHEKALETASMAQVAKGCGYANYTSTPFYRRLQSARLFKLLGSPHPELTELAWDYFKPATEDAKANALSKAIMGIAAYAEYVERNQGKRVNIELLTHSLARSNNLTDDCASTCAKAMVASLKFAGFFSAEGVIKAPSGQAIPAQAPGAPKTEVAAEAIEQPGPDTQTQTLYLDSRRKRKITIIAPLTVTNEELERIRAWLGFQLLVEPAAASQPAPFSAPERQVADQQPNNGEHE